MLHAHTRQYQKLKSNFKHSLKSKCQSKSVRKTTQLTYDQTKETNRIKDKKIEIIEKIADFFCQILQCDNSCDFFGCFDAIIRCDIFKKKTWDAMQFSMRCDCHPWLKIFKAKYLGIYLEYKLNFLDHIKIVETKVARSIGILYRVGQKNVTTFNP